MLSFYSYSSNPMALLAIASLAWFVVGVLAGRGLLPAKASSGKSRRRGGAGSSSRSSRSDSKGNAELYVGNLSYDVTEKDLYRTLGAYGRVSSVRVITNSFNGKSKGYSFVQMADRAASDKVIKAMNGKEYQGRKMVVNMAKNRAR